jgi:RNA polymerase sigma-70 factor (ECF subfamily)
METSASLLERVRQPGDTEAWTRFVHLYTPLLSFWASRAGLPPQDADDLIQDVFTLLLEKLPAFTYDPGKSFRAWLRTVTLNKLRERFRRAALPVAAGVDVNHVAQPDPAEAFWETEYVQHLVAQAMRLMQAQFEPATWQACWKTAVEGKSAAEAATELGMTPGAVRVARFRVLSCLRRELDGLTG